MATVPTLLYYLSLFLMVELDARKFGMPHVAVASRGALALLTKRYWFHFRVAGLDRRLHGAGLSRRCSRSSGRPSSTFRGVVPAPRHGDLRGVAAESSRAARRFRPDEALRAIDGVLNVAATCAAAGIIVGVVAQTGLGLKFSASSSRTRAAALFLTALYTALIVWVIGLAVPVTASYIICAVIAAPALTKLGVPDFAAHMFIFYYAVLSEVSPPTALSPFAAAAITGGDPYKTTLHAWKYTLPAFIVPFVFVLDPAGVGLLLMGSLKNLAAADWTSIAWVTFTAAAGIAAIAAGFQVGRSENERAGARAVDRCGFRTRAARNDFRCDRIRLRDRCACDAVVTPWPEPAQA